MDGKVIGVCPGKSFGKVEKIGKDYLFFPS
jgi:hypothetical protein